MNANELADMLEEEHYYAAALMMRQQQEQIDKLTAIVALRELKIERMVEKQSHYEALAHAGGVEAGKELKELTDEEIEDVYYKDFNWADEDYVKFARAILRKAQEK